MTVKNPLPTTSVLIPFNGATLSDQRGMVGMVAPRIFASGGSVLAIRLRETCRTRNALHGADDTGRAVEGSRSLDDGVVVRAARRRTAVG